MPLHVVQHPLAQHILRSLRDKETPPDQYRHLTRDLSTILILEATRDLRTVPTPVQTPLEEAPGVRLAQGIAVVPVLRAGLSMLEASLAIFPDVAVGYIGLERSEDTAIAHSYYCKLPQLRERFTICFDPMLATGGSASQALHLVKAAGAIDPVMVCVIAAPEGVARLENDHPDVPVYVAALDRELNEKKYILPGLGDFGDRLYGTMNLGA
ncbi:MAG TPA: uracil phosphoribosyltransferase [Fimbriimonadaceae bacterium]|nr:uracil phosphoribosyltransferase [Fimbriimonadaceae bacterium]